MKKKTVSLLCCLCVGLIATAVGAVNLNKAAAEETAGETAIFAMQAGASVRIDDDATQSGIRWNAVINQTYWNSFKTDNGITEETEVAFGSFVAPVENIDGELTENTAEVKLIECKDSLGNVISTPAFDEDGLFTFYSTILYNDEALADIEKEAYATELVARSYIRIGEGETASYIPVDSMYREVKTEEGTVNEYGYAYENSSVTRSMQAVALAATQAGTATETQVGKYYGDNVTTSAENSGYYSEADKTGSLTAAHADITSDFKAYVGALPVTVSVTEETLTISGFTGLKAGETYHLNLFSPEGNAYSQPFVYATKVIDEAADLAVFNLGSGAYLKPAEETLANANEFNGYYVLTKDIDCTGYVHTITTNEAQNSWGPELKKSGHANIGLTGVFEGNGHTISNLSLNRRGLFGMIVGGTVQNVGFTNVKFTRDNPLGTSGGYHAQDSYALACVIEKATLKNVYVHIPDMAVTVTISSETISTAARSAVRNAGLAYTINGDTTMQNCVVKIDAYAYASTTHITDFGSLMCDADSSEGAYANVKDVYVISGVKLAGSNQSTTTQADAANQSATITISGVKRYATETAMGGDAAANAASLATFSGEYWNVTDGVLSWGK